MVKGREAGQEGESRRERLDDGGGGGVGPCAKVEKQLRERLERRSRKRYFKNEIRQMVKVSEFLMLWCVGV